MKMNKILFFILGFMISFKIFSQSQERFLKFYETLPNIDAESFGVVTTSYGYIE